MGDVKIKQIPNLKITQLTGVEALDVQSLTGVEPLRIGQIAPAAVHIKELNHVDPLTVESLRVDEVRHVSPLRVEQLDITHMPTVDVSMSRLPAVDLNLRRMPPVGIGVQQDFQLPSRYTIHARFLGFEVMRFDVHGRTMLHPQDRARREQAHAHERSFPEVTPLGNPGIPTRREEKLVEAVCAGHGPPGPPVACAAPPEAKAAVGPPPPPPVSRGPSPELSAGHPRFSYAFPQGPPPGDDLPGSVSSGD